VQGIIERFDPSKLYGLIAIPDRRTNIFFHLHNCRPDLLGRQLPIAEALGTWVSFNTIIGITGQPAAMDVTPVIPMDPVDLTEHREESTIVRWIPNLQIGMARRESGDWLSFEASEIITEGLETLAVGVRLWHAIAFKERFGVKFDPSRPLVQRLDPKYHVNAVNIEIVMAEEQPAPAEPEIEVLKVEVPHSILMDDKFKKLKLRNIGIRKS
jgi:hypothetical protein